MSDRLPNAQRAVRSAFSLAELMIAMAILGLGLLVVAAMFPIAWNKARDSADFTAHAACVNAAQTSVQLMTQLKPEDNTGGVTLPPRSSFLGDTEVFGGRPIDPWVHALDLENLAAVPWPNAGQTTAPVVADFLAWGAATAIPPDPDYYHPTIQNYLPPIDPIFDRFAKVAIEDRFYPPLRSRPQLTPTPTAETQLWQAELNNRRFCWSVLYKQEFDRLNPPYTTTGPRSMTFYFVTLRRGQETHLFARQDPGTDVAPLVPPFRSDDPGPPPGMFPPPGLTAPGIHYQPEAYGPVEDVLLPVPWRVQIDVAAPPPTPTGVPTEAYANLDGQTNRLVTEMLPEGAWMIDELNGLVYQVTSRQILRDDPDQAILTLNQAVSFADLDDDGDGMILPDDPGELIRTVWVFPPPVEKRVTKVAPLQFIGPQPVVGIEVRKVPFSQ